MMAGVCAAIDARGPAGQADWRRHLELVLDGTRRRPGIVSGAWPSSSPPI